MKEKEIELINNIIANAIIHGADSGGSYEQNEEELTRVVNEWLKFKGVSCRYEFKKSFNAECGWYVHQIVPIVPVEYDLSWIDNIK